MTGAEEGLSLFWCSFFIILGGILIASIILLRNIAGWNRKPSPPKKTTGTPMPVSPATTTNSTSSSRLSGWAVVVLVVAFVVGAHQFYVSSPSVQQAKQEAELAKIQRLQKQKELERLKAEQKRVAVERRSIERQRREAETEAKAQKKAEARKWISVDLRKSREYPGFYEFNIPSVIQSVIREGGKDHLKFSEGVVAEVGLEKVYTRRRPFFGIVSTWEKPDGLVIIKFAGGNRPKDFKVRWAG